VAGLSPARLVPCLAHKTRLRRMTDLSIVLPQPAFLKYHILYLFT
jgi:hypothetical protein